MTPEQGDIFDQHTYSGKTSTSRKAAEKALGRSGSKRVQVAQALAIRPMSDSQIQMHLGMSPNTQRPRRVELVEMGFAAATGRLRMNPQGCREIVWELTDEGRRALSEASAA